MLSASNSNEYYGYYYNQKSTQLTIGSLLALTLLMLSVSRGLIPIILGSSNFAVPTYYSVSGFGIILSVYGLYKILCREKTIAPFLVWVLVINLLLHLYWVFPVLVIKPTFNYLISIVYTGIFPFVLVTFVAIPRHLLIPLLAILTVLVSFFILYDFVSYNTNLLTNGYQSALDRQSLLRAEFKGPGRTGEVLRPSGITGSSNPHDSGNLLLLFFTFWLALMFSEKKYRLIALMLMTISGVALFCSQSASNIIAACLGVLIIIGYYRNKMLPTIGISKLILLFLSFILLLSVVHLLIFDLNFLTVWVERLKSGYAWHHMLRVATIDYNYYDYYALLFGHGNSLHISEASKYSEIALITIFFKYGVLPALVLYAFLFYPIVLFLKEKNRCLKKRSFPYAITVFIGIVSLWHYGSLFRATNVFVFLAFYAQVLNMYEIRKMKYMSSDNSINVDE